MSMRNTFDPYLLASAFSRTANATSGTGGTPSPPVGSVQINQAGSFGGEAQLSYDFPSHTLSALNVAIASTGSLAFTENAGVNTVTITAPATPIGASYSFGLPDFLGGPGTVLQTDGAGNTTWAPNGGGGVTPGAPPDSVQFNNAGNFGGDARLTWDSALGFLYAGVVELH